MKNLGELQAIAFDFDGVFTDNRVIVSQNGVESVICNRADGLGLAKLRALAIPMIVISTEANPVVKERCKKLQLPVIDNCKDKRTAFDKWVLANNLERDHVAFMGNDINDCDLMSTLALSISVADAFPEVLKLSTIVTKAKGGKGAVREICDLIATHKEFINEL